MSSSSVLSARRTFVVPVVMIALGIAAIALIATLQGRSDAARHAQLEIAQITLNLERLANEPRVVSSRVGVTAEQADLNVKEYRGVVSEALRQLEAGKPPRGLVAASISIHASGPRLDAALTLARQGRATTPAGLAATKSLMAQQRTSIKHLAEASEDYSARAAFAKQQVLQGTVLTVLLMLSVFAFFYTRSVQDHKTVRRLFAENEVLLAASRDEALTDALTGLHNRRALALDLEAELPNATDEQRVLLALFDLDGFKGYNDTFGHAAGDELLHRLGRNLTRAAEAAGAKAYRLGGDEFCVLTKVEGDETSDALIDSAVAALSDEGEGWSIGTSVGTVWVPGDAVDVEAALVLADERMYSDKAERKNTRSTLKSLADDTMQRTDDTETIGRVAQMATVIAEHLALPDDEIDAVRMAAGLYDIGKTAIPDSILTKEGELDEDEWAFVRKHTIMSGRLVYAASERAHTASLVRSSHEHFDGKGYPDGLAGEEIPLGARIIAVCDAYNAMTSERPFRQAMSPAVALRELKSCAGSQFDPDVVDAFFASAAEQADSFRTTASASRNDRR